MTVKAWALPSPPDEWCHPRKNGSGGDEPRLPATSTQKVCSGPAEVCAQLEVLREGQAQVRSKQTTFNRELSDALLKGFQS